MQKNEKSILRVERLKKHFLVRKGLFRGGRDVVRAVDGLNFEIRKGETLGLVGESGCGKSTTGRLVLRLIDVTEGCVWFCGREITTLNRNEMRPLRSQMQIVFQDPYSSLDPRMTLKAIIGEGLRGMKNIGRGERKDRILDVMEKVGLRPEQYNRYPHEFSGGQRQRIGIARAIILNPVLIVADEPVSALDVSIQAQIINLLDRLKDELEISYLFISHDLSVVEHISDRIAVMYMGKIVETAPRDDLYGSPKHPYAIALLSAVPVPYVGKRKKRIILKGDIPSSMDQPKGCRFFTRCDQAREICMNQEPVLRDLRNGHSVACHLY